MPINGLFFEADTIPLRVRSVVEEFDYNAPSGTGPLVSHFVQGVTRETPDVLGVSERILLRAQSSMGGDDWTYLYFGPGSPILGYNVSGSGFKAALDLEIRIRGVKVYVNGPGNVDSHKWRMTWTSVEVWIEGALNIVLPSSAVDETSAGLGPCYLPLLGIPLEVTGGLSVGEPLGAVEEVYGS